MRGANPKAVSDIDRAIGRAIQAARARRGMTQGDLGAKVGVSHAQIDKYERGMNRISAGKLCEVAAWLNVRPSSLLPSVTVY